MSVRMADDFVEIPDLRNRKDEEREYPTLLAELKDRPIETVQALLRDCKKDMDTRSSAWARYRRKYRRGLQYANDESGRSYATNYAYNVVETAKANLLLGLPAITAVPVEEGDDLAAEVFTDLIVNALDRAELPERLEDMVQNGVITGFGWIKVWYDEEAFFKKGDIALSTPLPEDMFFLGNITAFNKMPFLIQRVRDVPEEELKNTYKVDYIEGDDDKQADRSKQARSVVKTHDMYETWVRNTDGKWWYCVTAGATVLQKPKKYKARHGKNPFIIWMDGVDSGTDNAYSAGIGEIEEMEPLLDLANSLDHRIYKNVQTITSRQRVLNPASGIDRNDVDDTPNRVYLCAGRPQDAMMWDTPPALGTDVYLYREKIEDRIQIVTGIYDVAQGQKPSGIQAARAISALQTAALKRLEKKQKTIRRVMTSVGELSGSLILENYTDERIIRTKGGRVCKIVAKYPESLKDSLSYIQPPEPMPDMGMDPMAMMGDMMGGMTPDAGGIPPQMGAPQMPPEMAGGMPPEMGAPEQMPQEMPQAPMGGMTPDMMPPPMEMPMGDEEPDETDLLIAREEWKVENGVDLVLEDIDFNYDIVITSDTVLPEDRSARLQLVADLFRLGVIDRKAVLDITDFPDAVNILKRLSAAETGKTPPEMSQDNAGAVQQQQEAQQAAMMAQMQQ